MKAGLLLSALLLVPCGAKAAEPNDCESPSKDLGPKCTYARVLAADQDKDGYLVQEEIATYVQSGDYRYLESVRTVKSVAPTVDLAPLLIMPMSDFMTLDCDDNEVCPDRWTVDQLARFATLRNRAWRPKTKPAIALKASRKPVDAADPRSGKDIKARPFVVSYKQDDVKNEEGLLVLGAISTPPRCLSDEAPQPGDAITRCAATLELDVDTASGSRGNNSSDIAIGVTGDIIFTPKETSGITQRLTVTPSYLTDADFGRDVLLLTATYALFSGEFGGPGKIRCIGATPCGPGTWQWTWLPSVVVQAGDVRDPSGNLALEKQQQAGSYVRLSPTLGLRLYSWDRRHAISLDLNYAQDVTGGLGKGYGELSYLYDISQNVAFTVMLRRGYKIKTLDEVDSVVVGFGFTF